MPNNYNSRNRYKRSSRSSRTRRSSRSNRTSRSNRSSRTRYNSRYGRRNSSYTRISNPGLREFLELKDYIANQLGIPRGVVAGKVASIYKKRAQSLDPNMSTSEAISRAREMFDRDSEYNRQQVLQDAEADIAAARKNPKPRKSRKSRKSQNLTDSSESY